MCCDLLHVWEASWPVPVAVWGFLMFIVFSVAFEGQGGRLGRLGGSPEPLGASGRGRWGLLGPPWGLLGPLGSALGSS